MALIDRMAVKSSFSNNSACVEVEMDGDTIAVRDTKQNGAGPDLGFTGAEWDAFIVGAKAGEFDRV